MELVRKSLLEMEQRLVGQKIPLTPEIEEHSEEEIGYHVALIGEAR